MSKSNYEKFAETMQPIVLQETKTLEDAISYIKSVKGIYATGVIDDYIALVSQVFNRNYSEIKDLVDGKEYWIV